MSKKLIDILYESKESPGPRIYKNLSITAALFRSLGEFERSVIIKLLSQPEVELSILVNGAKESQGKLFQCEQTLIKGLGVVDKFHKEIDGPLFHKINPIFRESLTRFLSSGLEQIFEVNQKNLQKCIEKRESYTKQLNNHAMEGWTTLYANMLEGFMFEELDYGDQLEKTKELTKNITHTLQESDMILREASSHTKGFDFLLDNIKNQVQIFLYSYVKHLFKIKNSYRNKTNQDVSEGEILNLILNLTLLVPGANYNVRKDSFFGLNLPEALVQDILFDLDSVGLIKCKKTKNAYDKKETDTFIITPLLQNILAGNNALQQQFKNNIIVETDFKIYAYSTSDNQLLQALLNLFTKIKNKFPGMIVCSLKYSKIMEAFSRGIDPYQILRYLNSNVHQKVIEKKMSELSEEELANIDYSYGYLPENIVQQMMIWFQEYQTR